MPHLIQDPQTKQSQILSALLKDRDFKDFVLVSQGREFPCHKAVLAQYSTVFKAMFTSGLKEEQESKVDPSHHDPDTVQDMIRYMYTGKVEDIQSKAGLLIHAAEEYDLKGLKELCENALM